MPFGSYDTPKPEQPPTFLQYAKTCGKGVEGKTKFGVDIVWMPGQFDNITLQTHAFRYICDSAHPLYDEIKLYFSTPIDGLGTARIDITIDSIEERKITVSESTKVKGSWQKLGSNAFRFKEN